MRVIHPFIPFLGVLVFFGSDSCAFALMDEFLFPDSLQNRERSCLFREILENPDESKLRKMLRDDYESSKLPVEAQIYHRTWENLVEKSDDCISNDKNQRTDAGYSVFCSLYHGVSREEARRLQDSTRKSAIVLARESAQSPCKIKKDAEAEIAELAFGCHLAAEWAYANILCATVHGDTASYGDLELSFRILVELETRGILPHSTPTSTDLFFFLARAFLQLGDTPTAIVLAEISVERFPMIDESTQWKPLSPNNSLEEITLFIKTIRSK